MAMRRDDRDVRLKDLLGTTAWRAVMVGAAPLTIVGGGGWARLWWGAVGWDRLGRS